MSRSTRTHFFNVCNLGIILINETLQGGSFDYIIIIHLSKC